MYKALYRKYRPLTFNDVVGQEHITSTLKNQVNAGRLSHAYLFVGTRGTGKTTCAKILSKAVNCHSPVNGDPCNKCPSCMGINSGSVLDVVELDAASNNGVDHIRAIRDEAVYTPSEVRKRVYIVDEVHMLSTAAFNALLKILEEPPEHLIFILATTELHKVPATILSRCQRYSFKRITVEDIAKRLEQVALMEQITLTSEASALLARLADGSMRDALSLMDQCRSSQTIDEAQVMSCIGLAGAEETIKLLKCVESGDTETALNILDKLYMAGKDPGGVLGELSAVMRDITVMRMAPKTGEALLSGTFSLKMLRGHKIPTEKLLWCVKTLQESVAALDRSPDRRTAAEFCLIKITNDQFFTDTDALLSRIASLEAKLAGGAVISTPVPAPAQPEPVEVTEEKPAVKPVFSAPTVTEKPAAPIVKEEPAPKPQASAENGDTWQKILKELDPPKARLLNGHTPVFEENRIIVNVGTGFAYNILNNPDNMRMLEAAVTKIMGKQMHVIITDKAVGSQPNTDKLDELRKFGNVKFR
ncbi:MAG: DNA polymerase III subunit gamma/tau [Ruminococcaceae bacterium]|nr:DNA polymerase III subunit gamma/tau [Oscillospiraceae bacterium]